MAACLAFFVKQQFARCQRHDFSGTGNTNPAPQHDAMHGDNHGHRVAMYRFEGRVVTCVDLLDQLGMGIQLHGSSMGRRKGQIIVR